jgi:hypothetical protein
MRNASMYRKLKHISSSVIFFEILVVYAKICKNTVDWGRP